MIVCNVCKTENEEHFSFCKNCGLPIKTEEEKPQPKPEEISLVKAKEQDELVAVYMMLPDTENPSVRTLQKVFVTPAQYKAMKTAGMFDKKDEGNE
jgi:hypothetical protein